MFGINRNISVISLLEYNLVHRKKKFFLNYSPEVYMRQYIDLQTIAYVAPKSFLTVEILIRSFKSMHFLGIWLKWVVQIIIF